MTLTEIGIVTGSKIEVRKQENKKFIVYFPEVEIACNECLISSYGIGETVIKAKQDYAKQLEEQILVLNALKRDRLEIKMPPKITIR